MASYLQLKLSLLANLVSIFYLPTTNATTSNTNPATPSPHDSFASTSIFKKILTNLGFQELSKAVPSLSDSSSFTTWNAPTNASIRSCSSCSASRLLREHFVPSMFSHNYFHKLAFGTKIETMDPRHCITVTSSINNNTKIFISGVEITRPDLFNNGIVVVQGLQGYVAPLSPLSCNNERMTSLSFAPQITDNNQQTVAEQQSVQYPVYIMRLMLRDAVLRLHNSGFSILALALKMTSLELINLQHFTVFAVDDVSIFSGSQSYVNNVRFHIIPNRSLSISDFEKLSSGTVLPTLESGQSLMVTSSAGTFTPMRINYLRIKVPDVMRNLKIVIHSIYLPFPHLHPSVVSFEESTGGGGDAILDVDDVTVNSGSCTDGGRRGCAVKPTVVRTEHQGL